MHFIAISVKGPDVLVWVRVADDYRYESVKIVEVFERRSIGSSRMRMCCTNIRKIKWKIICGKSRIIRTMGGKRRYNQPINNYIVLFGLPLEYQDPFIWMAAFRISYYAIGYMPLHCQRPFCLCRFLLLILSKKQTRNNWCHLFNNLISKQVRNVIHGVLLSLLLMHHSMITPTSLLEGLLIQ